MSVVAATAREDVSSENCRAERKVSIIDCVSEAHEYDSSTAISHRGSLGWCIVQVYRCSRQYEFFVCSTRTNSTFFGRFANEHRPASRHVRQQVPGGEGVRKSRVVTRSVRLAHDRQITFCSSQCTPENVC